MDRAEILFSYTDAVFLVHICTTTYLDDSLWMDMQATFTPLLTQTCCGAPSSRTYKVYADYIPGSKCVWFGYVLPNYPAWEHCSPQCVRAPVSVGTALPACCIFKLSELG